MYLYTITEKISTVIMISIFALKTRNDIIINNNIRPIELHGAETTITATYVYVYVMRAREITTFLYSYIP